jgi:hypothetical protein
MSALRVLVERLLLFLLLLSRISLVAFGLFLLGATFALGGFLKAENSTPAVQSAWQWIQLTGGLCLAIGIILFVFRNWIPIPRAGQPGSSRPRWIYAMAVCLLAQAALALFASQPILSLWQDAIPALQQAGVFQSAAPSSSMSGVVLAPVVAVMFVPILESAAALSLIVGPILLLLLFFTKSRAYPKSFVLATLLQAGLVAVAFVATNAFTLMAERLLALTASNAGNAPPEFRQALAGLRRIQAVIGPTARTRGWLVLPAIIWIPALMFSRRVEPAFSAGSFDLPRATERPSSGHGQAA